MKAEIIIEDNEVIRRLANYSDAAKISIEELIAEIIHDAVYGNDIKGSLEDTTKQRFSAWKEKTIWQGPYMMTESNISALSSRLRHIQPAAKDLQGQMDEPKSDYQERVDNLMDKNLKERPETKAALFKPKSDSTSFERSGPTSSDEVIETGFKQSGGLYPRSVPAFDPAEKARELLKASEESAEESVAASDIMYLSWIEDAVAAIKALPQGQKFVANQFLPEQATPEEARVFGKKFLQAITKHKLYASKRKGKSCMEYVKA